MLSYFSPIYFLANTNDSNNTNVPCPFLFV